MTESLLAQRVRHTLATHGIRDETSGAGTLDDLVAALLAALSGVPTEADAQAVGMNLLVDPDDNYRSLRARGMVHCITVMPNDNRTGWIVDVSAPSNAANLPQRQAEILAHLLLAGPGEDRRETCPHGTVLTTMCTTCLTED